MEKAEDRKHKIGRVDFGFNLSATKTPKKSRILPNSKAFLSKPSLKGFSLIRNSIVKYSKIALSVFTRVKWKVSRSIFLGRGVYFKYVSNLSILLIISIGVFIYSGSLENSESEGGFLTKFVFNAQANEGVLASSGSQTILSQKASIIKYKVQEKDTLSSIAQKFSTEKNVISVDTIKWANNLTSDNLTVGTVLEFPPVNGTLHTVSGNEDLISIAAKYGKTEGKSEEEVNGILQEIADINLLDIRSDGDRKIPVIVEGQKIIIPGGVIAPEPVKVAAAQPDPVSNPVVPQQILTQPVQGGLQFGWPVANGGGLVTQYYSGYHQAIDIADSSSPLLVSIGGGTVKSARYENGGGAYVVRVDLGGGFEAMYAHLVQDSFLVTPGETVAPGQALGTMGMTGAATGIHVHFELLLNGVRQDPLDYISR